MVLGELCRCAKPFICTANIMECVQCTIAFPTSHVSFIRISILRARLYAIESYTRTVFACANKPNHKGTVKLIFSVVIDGQRRTHTHTSSSGPQFYKFECTISVEISNRGICMRTINSNTHTRHHTIFPIYILYWILLRQNRKLLARKGRQYFSWPFDLSWWHFS